MKINRWQVIAVVAVTVAVGVWLVKSKRPDRDRSSDKIIHPRVSDIRTAISTTGTVLPKNRLQIKPPVNGRIEEVLVPEGQAVKTGDILAWMSSSDRAALLDTARGQGEEKFRYWQEVYKPIPLIAPIDGEVIVGTVQPGQAVTTADAVLVLSDRLIVRAQVDETDIGKIKPDQKAEITLDAYPETRVPAVVDHIYYESKAVNNVTIYEVDLSPETIPPFFRSGMNANIDFIQESKHDVLVLPVNAVHKEEEQSWVTIKPDTDQKEIRRPVVLGISDDKNVEIVSGLTPDDDVVLKTKAYKLPQSAGGSSPFSPASPRRR